MHAYVLLADCTYKTNHFHMPLLNIVGINSEGMPFNAAFARLKSEREADYVWAMRSFRDAIGEHVEPGVFVTDC